MKQTGKNVEHLHGALWVDYTLYDRLSYAICHLPDGETFRFEEPITQSTGVKFYTGHWQVLEGPTKGSEIKGDRFIQNCWSNPDVGIGEMLVRAVGHTSWICVSPADGEPPVVTEVDVTGSLELGAGEGVIVLTGSLSAGDEVIVADDYFVAEANITLSGSANVLVVR